MKTRISVRSIAATAGVSAMTVSRALRGEPNVDPSTALRIRAIADDKGYRRNLLVSTVMSTVRGNKQPLCSHVIAFLTRNDSNFPPQQRLASQLYLQGAQERATECGFAVEEFVIRPAQADSRKISRILYARNIRGLLVGPLCRTCGHLSLDWKEFSSSAISINLVKPDLNRCSVDIVQSVNLVIRNLKRLGYRRIGYAISPLQIALSHHRSRALYLDYQHQLPPDQSVRMMADWSLQGLSAWLKKEKPDALIGHGDEILAWLNEMGVSVPADLGYADINMVAGTHVPLAGVAFDYKYIGATAANMVISDLLRNTYGVPPHPVHSYIQGSWQDGSTACKQVPAVATGANKSRAMPTKKQKPPGGSRELFHPLASQAHPGRWRNLNLRKMATHSYFQCKDISQWEDGLGLPLKPGRQEINAVPFQLIDEKTNGGKGCVLIQNGNHLALPVGCKCEAAYFLIAAGYVSAHAAIAHMIYQWGDGREESQPLIAYYRHPANSEIADRWVSESGVQDWWPSFPRFFNRSAKAFKVAGDRQNPVEWRYLYSLEWVNPRPEIDLSRITFQTASNSDAKIAVFASTLLLSE